MICHHLLGDPVGLDGLQEHGDSVLGCGVLEHARSGDEPGSVIFVPEAVAVAALVPHVGAPVLFVWFVLGEAFFFEDAVDAVVADVDVLFCEDLFHCDRSQRVAAVCIKDKLFFFGCNRGGFPPRFFRVRVFGGGVPSSVEFAGPLRCDVLDFSDAVDGFLLGIDFFDDPPHLPLIQLPIGAESAWSFSRRK